MEYRVMLHGVFPAVVTPFSPDGEIDDKAFRHNFRHWNRIALAGYLVVGSTGESVCLLDDERARIIAMAREETPAEKILIVGTGRECTRATIASTRQAANLGADMALVVTPNYFKPTLDSSTFIRHYLAVADASPIPILLYNVPVFTGVRLPVPAVYSLSEHPNIVGMKDSEGNIGQIVEIASGVPAGFELLVGSTSSFLAALLQGAVGAILAIANVVPQGCVDLYQAVQSGDLPAARDLQTRLLNLGQKIAPYGIGGWKAALNIIGYEGGVPRLPLVYPDTAGVSNIQRAMQQLGFL